MEKEKKIGVGVTTCSSKEMAGDIVNELLLAKLIACGQIEGPIESTYRWKGKIEQESEWKITLKFDLDKRSELSKKIAKIHPYETPEWVTWEAGASEGYYDWVANPD